MQTATISFDLVPALVLETNQRVSKLEEFIYSQRPSTSEVEPPILLDEAAAFLQMEPPTLYKLAPQKKIPAHKQGRKWYFFKSELTAWIRTGKEGAAKQMADAAETRFLSANAGRRKHIQTHS